MRKARDPQDRLWNRLIVEMLVFIERNRIRKYLQGLGVAV